MKITIIQIMYIICCLAIGMMYTKKTLNMYILNTYNKL
uniref:Uncharacterized protein n=2 Tax=Gammaproteobacteria TaxID=1236 RepID=A0A514C8W1_MORMO|nr:hypothetical protein [Morganella morganii]QDX15392.1 hypothetical protein [Actinobacillus pleuropneumoniae]